MLHTAKLPACAALLLTALAAQSAPPPVVLRPRHVDQFMFAPDTGASLEWILTSPGTNALDYVVQDYAARRVRTGVARPDQEGVMRADVSLPLGYYALTFPTLQRTFGLVVIPEGTGTRDPWMPH